MTLWGYLFVLLVNVTVGAVVLFVGAWALLAFVGWHG